MRYRLEQLAKMEDGWTGRNSTAKAPGRDFVERFGVFLEALVALGVPFPFVYPLQCGGLRACWDIDGGRVEVECDPDGLLSMWRRSWGADMNGPESTTEDPDEVAAWLLLFGPLKGAG